MPVDLGALARKLDPGRTAVLLGAGAAHPSRAPLADELARFLASRLDPGVTYAYPLATTAELLELRFGRKPLVEALRDRLRGLTPTGGLAILPQFPWRALYTTNFDSLIEDSYRAASRQLTVIRSNFDFDRLEQETGTPLFKIHGCVDQDRALGHRASMTLTDSDYVDHASYRELLFGRLQFECAAGEVLIVGHSLADPHIRELVERAAKVQRAAFCVGRVHLLMHASDPGLAMLAERQGLSVTFGAVDELLDALAQNQPPEVAVRTKSAAPWLPVGLIAVTRTCEPPSRPEPNATRLFTGGEATFDDIAAGYTFGRSVEPAVCLRIREGLAPVALVGVAGVGKTTAARRVLATLNSEGLSCWEHRAEQPLRVEAWLAVDAQLRGMAATGVLLLDDVTRYQRRANELVAGLWATPGTVPALRILATAELGKWNILVKHANFFRGGGPLRMGALQETELVALLTLLDTNAEIARLVEPSFRSKSRGDRLMHLRRRCEADMFVCLKNIFGFETLDEIILKEYQGLADQLQDVYRHVAALHAAGVEVHRQLIIRMLGLESPALIQLYASLDGILFEEDISREHGVYAWRTRHRTIAEILTSYKFADQAETLSLLHRVIDGLNPSILLERRSIIELCTSDFGIARITSTEARCRLYESLVAAAPDERVPRHRLVREFLNGGDLVAAEVALEDAVREVGLDPPLQRYRVLLLLKRVEVGRTLLPEDRRALLSRARQQADQGLARFKSAMYMYFTFDDVAAAWFEETGDLAWLKESCERLTGAYHILLDPQLQERANRSWRRVESAVRRPAGHP